MPTTHFQLSVTLPDGRVLNDREVAEALAACHPSAHIRVTSGAARILVAVPENPEEDVIFGLDGRVQAMLVDMRRGAEALDMVRERVASGCFIELGSGPESLAEDTQRVVTALDEMRDEHAAGPGRR